MRATLLAMTLIAASTTAFAQGYYSPNTPSSSPSYNPTSPSYNPTNPTPPPPAYNQSYGQPSQQRYSSTNSGQENCGTPDQFKACPPLPHHALPYYPERRPDCGSCRVP